MKDKNRSQRHSYYRGGILAAVLLTVMIAGSALGSVFRVDQGTKWNIHISDQFVGNSVQGKTIRYHLQIDANKADSSRDVYGEYTGTLNLYADIEVPKPATGYMQYMYVRQPVTLNVVAYNKGKYAEAKISYDKFWGVPPLDLPPVPDDLDFDGKHSKAKNKSVPESSSVSGNSDYQGMLIDTWTLNGKYHYEVTAPGVPTQTGERPDQALVDCLIRIKYPSVDVEAFFIEPLKFHGSLNRIE